MYSYYSATIWDKKTVINKPPYTCKKAKPVYWETVQNLPVIEVIDARYRNATLSGNFVLSPFAKFPLPQSGTGKIDVLCRWFDHRLAKTGLTLLVDFANVQLLNETIPHKVISNIEK